jgi:hypothetical protein
VDVSCREVTLLALRRYSKEVGGQLCEAIAAVSMLERWKGSCMRVTLWRYGVEGQERWEGGC